MFGIVWSLINSASDAISPSCPIEQELSQYWTSLTNYYLQKNDHNWKQLVEVTHIPKELKSIANLLLKEDEDLNQDREEKDISIGNGFEYFLQNKLSQKLADLAEVDVPLGLSSYILSFFTQLIERFKQNILLNGSVFNCIQKLIKICDQVTPGPYEAVQVDFLSCLVNKIQAKPELMKLFARNDFTLLKSLTPYLKSPDNRVSYQASSSILILIQLCDDSLANDILKNLSFFQNIIDHLKYLYIDISDSLTADEIESALTKLQNLDENDLNKLNFKLNLDQQNGHENSFSVKVEKFFTFFRWFVFCDVLAQVKSNLISSKFAEIFSQTFLNQCIIFDLLKLETPENLESLLLTTFILSNCLKSMTSDKLASVLIHFITSDSIYSEEREKIRQKKESLFTILINRCNLGEISLVSCNFAYFKGRYFKLAISTMQLFEELFSKSCLDPFINLIIKYIISRNYLDSATELKTESSNLDESLLSINIHIKNFTNLIPKELKSCQAQREVGFEPYIMEAQKKLEEYIKTCSDNWPENDINLAFESTKMYLPEGPSTSNHFKDGNQVFFEGPFLSMLFDNLQNILQLPYEINLQVSNHLF